jgi:DNA-binding MarR family transcriptional regulator
LPEPRLVLYIQLMSLLDEVCLASRIRRVQRIVTPIYDDCLRPLGITIGQLDMLATIAAAGGSAAPAALGRDLAMERSTMSRNVRRLEVLGLVTLTPTRGRERLVELTRHGHRMLDDAYPRWREAQDRLHRALGRDGVDALELLVTRIGRL